MPRVPGREFEGKIFIQKDSPRVLAPFINLKERAVMSNARVQVNIPFHMLKERLADIIAGSINPEIYFDAECLDTLDPGEVLAVAETLKANGLRSSIHGPFMSLNAGAEDERVRQVTEERYNFLLDAIVPLDPVSIVLHAGYDAKIFDGDVATWLSQSMKTWEPIVEQAELRGLVIAAENVFEEEPGPIKKLVASLASPCFGVCLDAGHINLFSKVDMEEWFSELGSSIKEVHLHDNHGQIDDHLPIGEGQIEFPRFFDLLETHSGIPVYTIEPHGEDVLERGLAAVREFV